MRIISSVNRKLKNTLILSKYLFNRYIRGIDIDSPPTFIVGSGHSGTSILLAILGTHSKIYAIPYESAIGDRASPERYLKRFDILAVANGKSRWVEKTPKNIYHIERLLGLRTNARVILVMRDGRDVACSIQGRTGCLKSGIKRWVDDNRAGQIFWEHPNVFVLKYEKIIEDFKGTIASVLSFLGESFESECREFYQIPRLYYSRKIRKPPSTFGRDHGEYRNWQINQPLFDGRGKWKTMTEQEKRLVKEIAGEMLIDYGYARGNSW